jgi:hypothetical protein
VRDSSSSSDNWPDVGCRTAKRDEGHVVHIGEFGWVEERSRRHTRRKQKNIRTVPKRVAASQRQNTQAQNEPANTVAGNKRCSPHAPFIFYEIAPAYGFTNGLAGRYGGTSVVRSACHPSACSTNGRLCALSVAHCKPTLRCHRTQSRNLIGNCAVGCCESWWRRWPRVLPQR